MQFGVRENPRHYDNDYDNDNDNDARSTLQARRLSHQDAR
jgi:hypothetical protein